MLRKWINRTTAVLAAWHQKYLSAVDFMYILAFGIGILTGTAAASLKWAIEWVRHLFLSVFDIQRGNFGFLILPVVGILLTYLFAKYVIRQQMDHATDRLATDTANSQNALSPRLIFGPIVGCAITLGMGGSAGGEDPIAYSGAAIGSNVGRAFRLNQVDLAQLVGCGAAAGIAGIFMAPIGGVMYALEVLRMKQSLRTAVAVVIASLTAALTCYLLRGCHTDVTFMPTLRFENSLIPYVLGCGLFCGIYSAYYSKMMSVCYGFLKRYAPSWRKALFGGLCVAAMLFVFPSLYGEGYDTIARLMDDDPLWTVSYGPLYHWGLHPIVLLALMGVLLLVKPFATSSTNDTGGVGGDFTPTFFCGAIAGFIFASLMNLIFHVHLSYALFTFFGMAATMSGAIRAPLMAIFIAAEMTGLYGFILPLTLAAISSYLTTILIVRVRVPLPFLHRHDAQSAKSASIQTSQILTPDKDTMPE